MKTGSPSNRQAALTLVEVLVIIAVVVVIIGLIPLAPVNARAKSNRIRCISNLKQIGVSYRLWFGDHGDKYPMEVSVTNGGTAELTETGHAFPAFMVMSNELNDLKILVCPADVERRKANSFSTLRNDNVSYFVGLDAAETRPQGLLSGDRNITNGTPFLHNILELTTNEPSGWAGRIHEGSGNVGFADTSVMQLSSSALREQISLTGLVTNQLVMP